MGYKNDNMSSCDYCINEGRTVMNSFLYRVLILTMGQRVWERLQWSVPQVTEPPSSSPTLPATTMAPQWRMDRSQRLSSTLKASPATALSCWPRGHWELSSELLLVLQRCWLIFIFFQLLMRYEVHILQDPIPLVWASLWGSSICNSSAVYQYEASHGNLFYI